MASNNWQVDASGSWGTKSDWSGGVPLITDDVTIAVAGITVSIGSGVGAKAHTLLTTNSSLLLDGGKLETIQSATFDGAFSETSGVYTAAGQGAVFNQSFSLTGGSIDLVSGAAQINDGGTLSGTLSGAGGLDINAGNVYAFTGFACTTASIVIGANGGKLGLETNLKYTNDLTVLQNGVLDLFGHTLTLTGTSLLEGTIGFGVLSDYGTITLGATNVITTLDDGLGVSVIGSMLQEGNVALGATDSGAKIIVDSTGHYDINGNWNISDPSSVGSITNDGVFAKSFGGSSAIIAPSFSTVDQLQVAIGSLVLDGLVNSLSGTVSGAGTLGIGSPGSQFGETTLGSKLVLDVATVSQQNGIVVLNNALTYAGTWDQSGLAVLNLNGSAAKLTLTGHADFDGGTVTSYGGTLLLDSTVHAGNVTFGGPTTIDINAAFDQTNTITLGLSSNPTANIAAGATWLIEGDSSIVGSFGLIDNSGTFFDPNGSADSLVQPGVESTGDIKVNNSTLTLAGGNLLGGTLSGTGLLELAGGTTLESGLVATVAALTVVGSETYLAGNVTYSGNFGETGGNTVVDLGGHTLSLTGTAATTSLDLGLLTDGGTLSAAGHVVLGSFNIGGDASLVITGTGEQTGNLSLGPNSGPGTLDIAAGGSYVLDDDFNITGNTVDGSLVVAGTLSANGTGESLIEAQINETGLLQINDTLFELGDGGAFAGTVSGGGTLSLNDFGSNPTFDVLGTAKLTVAALDVGSNANLQLLGNLAYAGLFTELPGGTISLGADTLTLSGTAALQGIVNGTGGSGTGTLLATGVATLNNLNLEQTALLSVGGSTAQIGALTDNGEVVVQSAGTYTLDASGSIAGTGGLSVLGHLVANGDGTEIVAVATTVGGTLAVDLGSLTFSATVTDSGSIADNGASLTLAGAVVDNGVITANLGTVTVASAVSGGGGFVIGAGASLLDLSKGSAITASNTISFTAGGGLLEINDIASFGAHLANFSAGDSIELSGFNLSTLTHGWNAADTQLTVSDSSGDTLVLSFTTAQTPASITVGTSTTDSFVHITHI
jgi:hypothetical protein